MTEYEIDSRVMRHTEHLDWLVLAGKMPKRDYDLAIKDLARWADAQRREIIIAAIWGRE